MLGYLGKLRAVMVPLFALVCLAGSLQMPGISVSAQGRKSTANPKLDRRPTEPDIPDARKVSNVLVRIPIDDESDRVRAYGLGTVVNDFGNSLLLYGNKGIPIRRFGEGVQKVDTTIHLPGATFEPINTATIGTDQTTVSPRFGRGYYVLQLAGIATDDTLDAIRGLGIEILQYVPNNAFFVYGDAQAVALASNHSQVRWAGEYTADQRIPAALKNLSAESDGGWAYYNIAIFGRADLEEAAEKVLKASGGRLLAIMQLPSSYFNVVRVEMSTDAVDDVAAIEDVVGIDPYQQPSVEDERSAQILAGNYSGPTTLFVPGYGPLTQFDVDGSNVTVAVADDGVSIPGDGGFYITASNTANGPLYSAPAGAAGGHGHLNASIIAGNAPFSIFDIFGYNFGLGVAPGSHIVNIPLLREGYPLNDQTAANDTVITPGPNGVKATISNNSWGAGLNGNAYDSLAATYDSLSRDSSSAATVDPLLFVFSAGNSGASGLTRPKVAKNVISVANSENIRTVNLSPSGSFTGDNIDDLSSSSSRGPAADGRIKPDITAPGSVITGGRAGDCSSIHNCFDPAHVVSSGTSHAAPHIAGAAALFTQFWKSTHLGANPSIAMTKAAILQSGQEMSGVGTSAAIPNGAEGWGRANMKFMLKTGVLMRYVDQTVQFGSPGEEVVYTGEVVDGSKPFRATLVWTDPPGVSGPALVNNLDLTVSIGSTVYRGNVFAGGLSASGGVSDNKNNVEHVWRGSEGSGTPVTVKVSAAAINGNGVLGNSDATDQNFALVVYNFAGRYSVAGRIVTPSGRGVNSAIVSIFDGPNLVARTVSNSFGYYRFVNILGGKSYELVIRARPYNFAPHTVNLDSVNLENIDLTAIPGP